jgi:hypothetical protein
VGLNVDKYTVKILDKANDEIAYESITLKDGQAAFSQSIESEFANSQDTANVELGVRTFIDWIKSGKL